MTRRDRKVELFRRSEFFERCTPSEIDSLARVLDCVYLRSDESVIAGTADARWFVVVLTGSLDAVSVAGHRRVICRNEAWGTDALLAGVASDERLAAREPSTVVVAGPRQFNGLLQSVPGFAKAVSTHLARELIATRTPRLRLVALPTLG